MVVIILEQEKMPELWESVSEWVNNQAFWLWVQMDAHTPTSLFFLNFALYMFKYNLLYSIFIYFLQKGVCKPKHGWMSEESEHVSPIQTT